MLKEIFFLIIIDVKGSSLLTQKNDPFKQVAISFNNSHVLATII
jgi:hypothetical protein